MSGNSTSENEFVKRLTKIVEANLQNEQFGVNELAQKAGLSRSQIHRRLKSISNKSVSQFIREVRLEKAKEFLEEGTLSVSEIAWKVGFGSPSYFIKSFHDLFGYPPGEFVKYATDNSEAKEDKVSENEYFEEKNEKKSFFATLSLYQKVLFVLLISVAAILVVSLAINNKTNNKELSIAVLPVDNLTGNDENEFIAYGMQDELIGELSKLKELRVISKTSSREFGDNLMLMKEIAKKLNADLLVEVSLMSAGDSVKILLKLVDVFPKERSVLSAEYKTDIQNIFQIYTTAARDIASQLHLNLADDVKERLRKSHKTNPESLKAYYRGMYYLGKDDQESFDLAIKYLSEAIDNDPADPFAYAAVALGYAIKGHHSNTPADDFSKAEFYADMALKLDSTIDEAYTARAMLNLYQKWEWKVAKNAFTEALKINPNNEVAHAHFAWYYVVHRDFGKAIFHAEKAVELNPLYIAYNAWLACIYYNNKEYEKAENSALEVLSERENSVYGNIIMGWINLLQKNYPEAITFTEKLPKWDYYNLYRAYAYYKAGETEKALSFKNAMDAKAKNKYVWEWHRGLMAAIFGNREEAFTFFNLAIDKKQYQVMYLTWYPFTESIKNDPRFNELLIRMNLPPYNENQMNAGN
jgi:AraC-like DNA-binding protein/TolB-like protein